MNDTLLVANGTNLSDTNLLISMNSINLILGLPVNSYVLWLILSGAGGTTASSEFFYLNLIVCATVSVLDSGVYLVCLFTHNLVLLMFENLIYMVCFWICIPSFQCCVCVERYVAVVHPVVYLRYKPLRYKAALCCAVWLTAIAFCAVLLTLLAIGLIDYVWFQTVFSYITVGFYVACICVVCFCCLSVLRALKQPGPGEGQRDSTGEGNDLKRRAFRIILISLVVMSVNLMSLIPHLVITILNLSIPVAVNITYALTIMSVFVHPLLYMYKAGKLPCFKGLL